MSQAVEEIQAERELFPLVDITCAFCHRTEDITQCHYCDRPICRERHTIARFESCHYDTEWCPPCYRKHGDRE